jgi:hypothetical protein
VSFEEEERRGEERSKERFGRTSCRAEAVERLNKFQTARTSAVPMKYVVMQETMPVVPATKMGSMPLSNEFMR